MLKWRNSRPLPAGRRTTLKNMYYIYAISSKSRKYIYVGITNNINRRFNQHQDVRERTTAPYRPFELILKEVKMTRPEAREREKYLKSGAGKEWLKKK